MLVSQRVDSTPSTLASGDTLAPRCDIANRPRAASLQRALAGRPRELPVLSRVNERGSRSVKPGTLAERTIAQSAMSTVETGHPSARTDEGDASASTTPASSARAVTRSVRVAQ